MPLFHASAQGMSPFPDGGNGGGGEESGTTTAAAVSAAPGSGKFPGADKLQILGLLEDSYIVGSIPGGLVLLCLAGFIAAKIKNRKKGQNKEETIYDADYKVVKSSKDAGTDAGGSASDEHYPGVSS